MPAPLRRRSHASSSAGRPRKPAAGELATLRIESLAAGGAGVAHLEEGAAVFIPGAAPDDLVEADVDRNTRPARGKLLRVLEPGAGRVAPGCSFIAACGGCDWMHLTTTAQESAHAEIVRQAILRATSLEVLPAIRVHPAPAALEYRTRARLFAKASGGCAKVGYRAAGTHDLAAVDACLVLDASIDLALLNLPSVLEGASGEGDILVARGQNTKPVVEILWKGNLKPSTWASINERIASGAWAGARVRLEGAARPASFGDARAHASGADGLPLLIAPGGFAQPSDEGAAMLARRVAELASLEVGKSAPAEDASALEEPPSRALHTVELFAGSGTLSILLARAAASFTAVELDEEAVLCARQNFAARGLTGKHIVADANAFPIPPRTELVVLDPPRAGASGAVHAIAAAAPRVVVYVACDPATLARDLATLTGASLGTARGSSGHVTAAPKPSRRAPAAAEYTITDIETFELFPQTSHIETVVRLVKKRGRSS